MARLKPTPIVIADKREATVAVAEIAALDRQMAAIECDMQAEIDAAKARARQRANSIAARRAELANGVAVWAKLYKAELFRSAKTLDLGHGKIGFRASTAITQERGVTVEMSLARCHELGRTDGIRLKEELNKERMLAWPDERLSLVGCKRQQRDTFFIDIPQESIPTDDETVAQAV